MHMPFEIIIARNIIASCFFTPFRNKRNVYISKRQKKINSSPSVAPEFGKIQKFSRLAEQVGESNNKSFVNCIFVQKSGYDYAL